MQSGYKHLTECHDEQLEKRWKKHDAKNLTPH